VTGGLRQPVKICLKAFLLCDGSRKGCAQNIFSLSCFITQ
jgi:hypothetical protein